MAIELHASNLHDSRMYSWLRFNSAAVYLHELFERSTASRAARCISQAICRVSSVWLHGAVPDL